MTVYRWPAERLAFRVAVLVLPIAAVVWLTYQFWRLLFQPGVMGAVDLLLRGDEVHRWFAGEPIYLQSSTATYPPASLLLLWPFVGWTDVATARWLWAAVLVASIAALMSLVVRESGANGRLARAVVALVPVAMYATGASVGNGQLSVPVLLLTTLAVLAARRSTPTWRTDVLASALYVAALVKPTLSAPFVWLLVLAPGGLRRAGLVAGGYAALTLLAASVQPLSLPELLQGWLARAATTASTSRGPNMHFLLGEAGLSAWVLPASIVLVAGLGIWVYQQRQADDWRLLGVCALVAQFWAYHLWYDDVLVLLPMVALYRVAHRPGVGISRGRVAGILLAGAVVTTISPGGLYTLPSPWREVYVAGQVAVWLAILIFLLMPRATARERVAAQPVGDARHARAGSASAAQLQHNRV